MAEHSRELPVHQAEIDIREACFPDELSVVQRLFRDYAGALGVDLCFQGFEAELASLPGRYSRPGGRLWLAMNGLDPAGCVALRSLDAKTGEMKRLYVRPEFRGRGLGQRLISHVLTAAKEAGYDRIFLDTLPSMVGAIHLYRQLGFKAIEPYCNNPVPGAIFFSRNVTENCRSTAPGCDAM